MAIKGGGYVFYLHVFSDETGGGEMSNWRTQLPHKTHTHTHTHTQHAVAKRPAFEIITGHSTGIDGLRTRWNKHIKGIIKRAFSLLPDSLNITKLSDRWTRANCTASGQRWEEIQSATASEWHAKLSCTHNPGARSPNYHRWWGKRGLENAHSLV